MSDSKPHRRDLAILGSPTDDGQGTHLLRLRDGNLTVGEIRPVKEGQPITHSELVRLHPVDEAKRVCTVEVLHDPSAKDAPERVQEDANTAEPSGQQLSRPARVANARYRKNWDTIFDAKRKPHAKWSMN